MVLNKNEPKTGKRLKGTNAAKEDTPAAISGSQKLKIFNIFKILKGVCQSHILPAIKAKAATPPLPFCYNLDFQKILKAKLSEVFVNFHSAKISYQSWIVKTQHWHGQGSWIFNLPRSKFVSHAPFFQLRWHSFTAKNRHDVDADMTHVHTLYHWV